MKTRILIVLVPVLCALAYLAIQWPHPMKFYVQDTFYMNEDFETVRKTMVRTQAMTKMLEMTGGTILDQKWDKIHFSTDRLSRNSNWIVEASCVARIHVRNDMGDKTVKVRMCAHITPAKMVATITLLQPVDELRFYQMVMNLSSCGNKTKVDLRMDIGVLYKAPPVDALHAKVDEEIRKGLMAEMVKTREGFIRVIKEYKNQSLFLKLK